MSWLRTPGLEDVKTLPAEIKPKQRLMVIYCTIGLPAVQVVCDATGCTGVLVMEDTCILRPDVGYEAVAEAVRECRAGVFGYGNRWQK